MATQEAQPLPLPPPAPELGPMDVMLTAAAGATGGTHPDAVVGAASTAKSPDEAVTNAQAIAGYSTASAAAKALSAQTSGYQQSVWGSLSVKQQDAYKAAGYKPPGGGFWSDVGHVFDETGHLIARAANDTTNVLGAPLRAEQHAERTAMMIGSQGPGALASLSDWANDWDETTTGRTSIWPQFKQKALAQYGQDTYNLALKLATGQTPQQILAAVPTAQQQQVAAALQSKDVQDAAGYLNAGHLSEGRYLAAMVSGGVNVKPNATFNWISGGIDGLLDWFGDPFVIGAKVGDARLAARYMVTTAEDVENLYARSASVRRASEDLASHISDVVNEGHGMASLLERYPKLVQSGAVQQLIGAEADTTEKVKEFWASKAGLNALLNGRAAHAGEAAVLPHLGYAGVIRLGAKGVLARALHFTPDADRIGVETEPRDIQSGPLSGGVNHIQVGRDKFATRLLRLVPTARTFKATGSDALNVLRDILSTFHSPEDIDRILSEFATNPDLGSRWNIYRSAVIDMGKAAGLDADPERWQRFVDRFASTGGRKYAPGDLDMDYDAASGQRIHVGILKAHLNDNWGVPSFKDLYVDADKGRITNAVLKASNVDFLDRMMNYWRPLTLARLGFATRVGGEEALGFLLREGPVNYLRGVAAELAYKLERRAAEGAEVEAEEPLAEGSRGIVRVDHGRLANMLSRGLSREQVANAKSIADLWSSSFANAVHGAIEGTGKAFTFGRYKDAVDMMVQRGALDEGSFFAKHLTALHYDSPNDLAEGIDEVKDIGSGKVYNAELKGTGEWVGYNPSTNRGSTESLYHLVWQRALNQLASDDWGRMALGFNRAKAEVVQDITNRLLEDPAWKESHWSAQAGGKYVGDGADQVAQRTAAEMHAGRIYDMAYKLTHSPSGQMLNLEGAAGDESLAHYMRRTGKAPPWWASKELRAQGEVAQLSHLRIEDLPKDVQGPEMVLGTGKYNVRRLTNWMFRKYIGPQINFISRQPMFIHNLAESMEAYAGQAAHMGWDEDFLFERAQERAFNATIPYVHNPELRSQMSTVTRNLAPFWFAQEQFYKRWARTFIFSPWAFRQLQLISGGLSHSGFVHTDPENGQEYFVYPGSAQAIDVVSHVLQAFGIKDEIPVQADITGYVSMLNPGITRGFLPNYGPVVTLPLDGIKQLDPHFSGAIDAIQGGQASNSDFLSSVVPSTVLRAIEAIPDVGQTIDASQYASAQMSAIQYLEATGNGLGYPALRQVGTGSPPTNGRFVPGDYYNDNGTFYVYQPGGHWANNSPAAMQTYLGKVNNWARIFFAFRLLYGFAAPASPEDYFNPKGYSTELQTLMNEMPYQQAVATFMTLHPDANAMTVFQTQDQVDGYLPATQSAMNFLNENPTLTQKYPDAATYFIPTPDTAGAFSLPAYQEQLAEGLRSQRTPQTYWQEISYQSSANVYYGMEAWKDQQVADRSAPTQQIDEQWAQWSEQFMLANPLFAQMYTDTGNVTREEIMQQVGDALNDPSVPKTPQYEAVLGLYTQYRAWQAASANYGQPNAPSTTQAYAYNEAFAQWVSTYEQKNPGVQPLVQRVIAPMLASTLTDMAAEGTAITL